MNHNPVPRLRFRRRSLLSRLLGNRLLLLLVGGWLVWRCAPVELVDQARTWADGLPTWSETDGLSDDRVPGARRGADRDIDTRSLQFFEPVIEALFGDEAELRDGRLQLHRAERYAERLERIDET